MCVQMCVCGACVCGVLALKACAGHVRNFVVYSQLCLAALATSLNGQCPAAAFVACFQLDEPQTKEDNNSKNNNSNRKKLHKIPLIVCNILKLLAKGS